MQRGPAVPTAVTSPPPGPSQFDRANPRPDPAGSLNDYRQSCPDALPLGNLSATLPGALPRLQHPTTLSIPSSDWCHGRWGNSLSDPGSQGKQGGAGVGLPLGSMPSLRSAEGREPASYLFPTPVTAALPGPTAFPLLPPQTAGSPSPTGATSHLGGAHPSYLTAEARASECSYWGRREREAGTGEKPPPLIGQKRCHSQLQGFCGLTASEPLKSVVPNPSVSWSESFRGGNPTLKAPRGKGESDETRHRELLEI